MFPDPNPGDYIEAEWFKAIYDALDKGIQVVPPLIITATGAIGFADQPGFWIEFTGAPTGAKHPWKQVVAAPGGTWDDGAAVGTVTGADDDDPAWEINGSTANLSGKRARAWRDVTSFEVRFAYGVCS